MGLTTGNNIISDKVAYLRMRIDKEARNRLKQWTTAVRIFAPSRRCIKTQFPSECSQTYKLISKSQRIQRKMDYIEPWTRLLSSQTHSKNTPLPDVARLWKTKHWSHLDGNANGFRRFGIQSFYSNIAFPWRILIMPSWFIFSSDGAASRDEQTFV